jgi:hypothetical protein
MPYLKLHRDETETETETQPPQPLPFSTAPRRFRDAGEDGTPGEEGMDSIARVEQALNRVEGNFERLSEQVDELCEPIRMADWLDSEDDGPWAA